MKIGEMFPSEYLRGIDITRPMRVTIEAVKAEKVSNQSSRKSETEFVMTFKGLKKKLRLNITMAKECALILNDAEGDTDNWIGKDVTVYQDRIEAFGKEHIVPRIRKIQPSDKGLDKAEKGLEQLSKVEFFDKVKNELGIEPSLAGYIVMAAGYVNGGGYQSAKAPEMWAEIKATGDDLKNLIQDVLENIPFYANQKQVVDAMKELGLSYSFGKRIDIFNKLATHANGEADIMASAEQESFLSDDEPQGDGAYEVEG